MILFNHRRNAMETATHTANDVINRARGRKDNSGQEGIINTTPLKKSLKELEDAYQKFINAKDALSGIVKSVAEKTNLQSGTIRKLLKARNSDKVEDTIRSAEQVQLVLEEFGSD